jgi:hypothetical protein
MKYPILKAKIIIVLAILAAYQTLLADETKRLIINELMSNNVSFVMDEERNYSMWVEIYNPGITIENLRDYTFTDDPAEPEKWRPNDKLIAGGSYATLWFERPEVGGHASFKLDPDGGSLYLMKNGETVDMVNYPKQYRNVSWGRKTDGADEWVYFTEPSKKIDVTLPDPVTAVSVTDMWSYWYDTTPPSDGWKLLDYNETGWVKDKHGPYGYGKEVNTVIGSPRNPPVQTGYFRRKFKIEDKSQIYACLVNASFDDAAAVYINGIEIFRYNLPEGELSYSTPAITAYGDPSVVSFNVPLEAIVTGENIVSAEVHQSADLSSSDYYFSLSLTHNKPTGDIPTNPNSNNGHRYCEAVCAKPIFNTPAGFYSSTVAVSFASTLPGETVHYTTDGSEPSEQSPSLEAGKSLQLTKTTVVRACAFAADGIPSEVATSTYFINERNFSLPVVSISTDQKNLFDNQIGIYVSNNVDRDWDRPANFELFDTLGVQQLSQELDIAISGGYSRTFPLKSLKISPRNKFGDKRLRYDFFVSKSGNKYRDIQLRNSGNDFKYTMFRDGFMQTLVIDRLDIDYQAYQPAVLFLNGAYYGIENLRERTNKDYLYSNYDLEEGEFFLLDTDTWGSNAEYNDMMNYINSQNTAAVTVYNEIEKMLDIDSYIDYIIAQIYYSNTDWPWNNYKMWRPKAEGGRWRWLMYDLDFGFARGGRDREDGKDGDYYFNSVQYVMTSSDHLTIPIRRLILNTNFKKKFISRFCVQLATTFERQRVDAIMDSLVANIITEIPYHKQRWGGLDFDYEITLMKRFSLNRPDYLMNFLSQYFYQSAPVVSINISSNAEGASYTFNNEPIDRNEISLKYFRNQAVSIKAADIPGLKFKQWELSTTTADTTLISYGEEWRYWDKGSMPAINWMKTDYDASDWPSGKAVLGYGSANFGTTIDFGPDKNNKYPTAYFVKTINIPNLATKNDFRMSIYLDDGAAIYINGERAADYNLSVANPTFETFATGKVNNTGQTVDFEISKKLLREGINVIAVEMHQCDGTSSDLVFDFTMSCKTDPETNAKISTLQTYSTAFTGDGNLKAVYELDTAIESIEDVGGRIVREIRMFDLLGRPVGKNAKGFVIKQTVYDNNTCKSEKIFVKE